ncbi:phospholipase D-like domain-containing protein [Ketobacter alkanivorans]|jgi:cardiolipin synthase A/B|nr:phospholipase D-like domain-containing protein [Ketobacter alkanivorans]|tara:strand:+ start:1909 stop:3048 length:1140 start_codon:yes stop_codon:yes gene_type:complete
MNPDSYTTTMALLPTCSRGLDGPDITDETFQLFIEGDDLYNAMLAAIRKAQHSVQLESYIFADDNIGQVFARALVDKARQGITVKVHLDAAGSLFWVSRRLENMMRHDGVQLRWFHRWSWRNPWRYNRRNHRKLLIVDEETAFLGGFNIHKESSRRNFGEARWRDSHVRVGGQLSQIASQLFEAFWEGSLHWSPVSAGSGDQLLHNHSRNCNHRLRCVYIDALKRAERYIYITTPYLVPDQLILSQLYHAASRGVEVFLLVPEKSDVPIARWAAQSIYAGLFSSGVRVFEYLPRMLHAKTIVVDDGWSMVGTANLDYRSLFHNYELNLVSTSPNLATNLKAQFLVDLAESAEIGQQQWKKRGLATRSLERFARLFRYWL